ncbi:uncharacterized protein LOC143823038 [Paroedura picta]|uniref:uncharacterized protein LOC143823038 n=1 Tax=Paroedura picta TaxID=143630 RepID=UPI0040579ADE
MAWAFLLISLVTSYSGANAQPVLTQPPSASVSLGNTVKLSCALSSGYSSYVVGWYQQDAGEALRFILYGDSTRGDGIPERFTGSKSGGMRYLTISSIQVGDEADYYCGAAYNLGEFASKVEIKSRVHLRKKERGDAHQSYFFLQEVQELVMFPSMLWAILLPLLSHTSGVSSQGTLTQPPAESVALGNTVRLSARLSSGEESYYVGWYQQREGQTPRLLVYRDSSTASGIPDRFSGSKSGAIRYLTITGVQPEDEATYYCGVGTSSWKWCTERVCSLPTVTQSPSESVAVGGTVRLSAHMSSGYDSYGTEWYQQREGQPPRLLVYSDSNRASGIPDRFSGSKSGSHRYLTITGVQPEDEATYYLGVSGNQ